MVSIDIGGLHFDVKYSKRIIGMIHELGLTENVKVHGILEGTN